MKAIGERLTTLRTAVEALLTPEQKAKLEGCLKAPRPNAAKTRAKRADAPSLRACARMARGAPGARAPGAPGVGGPT